jgi:RNA polymerase sigma-70 factor (ECF subfamily)
VRPAPRARNVRGERVAGGDDIDGDLTGNAHARRDVERLYREEAPGLRRRLRARLRSTEDAGDLLQDAFARLLGARISRPLDRPEAFLNRIVRNLLIDRARRRASRAPHLPIDEAALATRADQADAIELAQMQARYRSAVQALPPRMREVFVLHRIDGLGYDEIAKRLDISARTVEWHIGQAILRIGRQLDQS